MSAVRSPARRQTPYLRGIMRRMLVRHRGFLAPITIVALLAGCESPQGPAGSPELLAPSYNFTNGPPTAGPFVARVADAPVLFINADVKNDLMSIHIAPDVFFCGGSSSFNLGDIQFVTTPSQVRQFIALIKDGDGAVAVYGTSDFVEAFGPGGPFSDIPRMCAFMNGPEKLVEGTARRTSVLSNTAFAVSWTGRLSDADGDDVGYSEHQTFLVNPVTGESSIPVSRIHLTGARGR